MKKWLKITLNVLGWGAIVAYLVVAASYCTDRRGTERLREVSVTVTDYDRRQLISPETVREWIDCEGVAVPGMPMDSVNTHNISELVASHAFIREVMVYTEMDGTLNIEVNQRMPVIRVVTGDGYDFYVSEDGWILPSGEGSPEYVQLVSGNFSLPFAADYFGSLSGAVGDEEKKSDKNYIFLCKLINFVELVAEDPFWNSAIVQIDISDTRARLSGSPWREPEAELIPRVGNHIIVFGTLDDAAEKLDKLKAFYGNVLDYEGWDIYSRIDVSNRGQVVCR